MEQGHHPESHLEGYPCKRSMPVSDTVCAQAKQIDGHRVLDELLDNLVRLMARRVATIIIENGEET